ncbi:hypothetical protein CHS0354_017855 [Potamilus streckersoni]|uniref:non-specific serine/threonine protein kinase n=1 Tax=Potamilus streckersoni TaxID=2493646 RepID=A0AAE0T7S1_9BIVA|nr:hypothetical protein CHS0354_017855 [Potamilus streckersoni]
MGLKTEISQHHQKKTRQIEDQAKSPDNGVNIRHLCRQRRQLVENENIHQKLEKDGFVRSDQKQEVSNKSCQNCKQYLLKIYDEEGKENEKESEKEVDTIKDEHVEQENAMVIKSLQFDKNKDQNEILVKHVDENFSNKISLKQKKDQENLHQIQKNQKGPDRKNNLKDTDSENKWKNGEDFQSKQMDNKDAYDSGTNPEKFPWEEETYVKMLPGGDENEDGNSIEKSYWETDGTGRFDSMDSLGFKTKLNIVTALFTVQRDSNRLQEDVEKRFSTTFPGVVSHAVSHRELSMLCDLHEKEMKPIVTEAIADLCRMEGDYTEVFEVPSLLSGELSTIPLSAKLGKSIGNSVTLTVSGEPKEDFIEKHEIDVLEHEKEKFTEQPEKSKLMIQVEELVCLLEEMKTYMSTMEERMEKSPIHIFGLTDGRQHYDLPRHNNNSGRGHSTNGKSQSGSPPDNTAAGGDHQGSDKWKNKKEDSKKDEEHLSGKNTDNPEVNSPTVQILDTQIPPLDFKSYRRKHCSLSIYELTMYLGYLGNLQLQSQEEAPPWKLHIEVNSCLEVVVDNFDPILDEALSCQICVTLSSHLKHFADCLLPYTSSCLVCRQIFMLICLHVKTCIDKSANLCQQKQQPQQQLSQICNVNLCQKITSFVSGDVDKLYRTLCHIWPRVKKTLAGLLRSEEIWDPQSTEFPFPVKIPLGPRSSGKGSTTLPSIPEHESLPRSSSYTSLTCEMFSSQGLAQSREGEEHDEGEENGHPHHLVQGSISVVEPSLVLGTAGIGDSSLEQSQNSVSESNSSSFSGRIYNEEGPSSLPNVHFHPSRGQLLSLIDRPMGIPGIGEVVYGNKWQLVKVAKFWGNLKLQYQMEGHLALHYREEGVILSEYKKQLQIMKTRYQENFQYQKLVHLGNGMSGKCHLAQDWNTEYKFCLKKIHISHYEEKEIEIWSELEHTYIVKLYGAIRLGEMVFILAEFIDGGCLTEAINTQRSLNCRLSHRLALHYFKQLLQVLCYLRNKDILHEDLKADNILLSQNDRSIRVADFGLARRITHQKKGEQPFGTQTQWSPEKAGSEGHGFPSEVWAAVCVLVHMLSGYPPWVRRFSDAKLLHFVIVQNSPPIQDIPKNVNPVVQDLIVQGLELDPVKRPTADALLKHKAFTLFESGPPSDQIYSTLLTSSSAAMLPLNHLDENTSILQEIYHSLAIPSVVQGVNGKENSIAIPIVSQGVNGKENSQHKNSIVSLQSQRQRSTNQKEGGPEYRLPSAKLSGNLKWLNTCYTTPQVSPDLLAMPVFVNPDLVPFFTPENQVPSYHFYDYLYDQTTTAQQPQPDSTELQVYTPDDVSYSGSSCQSYNLSDEDVNSNLPNFSLLDVDRELENFKKEVGLQVSVSPNSSVFRQVEKVEIPVREPDNQHDSWDSFDSFKLFGDGEPTIPSLPKFGDITSFYTGEMFMLTDTKKPDHQYPCSKCTLPDSEFNENASFDRMTEPEEKRGVPHQIILDSAKMQEVKLLQDLSSSAKQQESSQNSSKLDIQPKDQQSYMMRHSSYPIIQTTENLHPPTQPLTAPPDQKASKPFPEFAVLSRNPSSLQQLQTQIPRRTVDQDKAATFLDTLDSQKTSAVTVAQNMTSFNPPSQNSSSVRLPSDKSEKDLHNVLLKLAASERDKTSSSRPSLHLDLKRTSKMTHKTSDKRTPSTAPAMISRENKEPDEEMMCKSCDEMQKESTSSNTRSTPSPVHTTPKSAYDEQEEEFRRLETESQQSDEILNHGLDNEYETQEQVNAELSIEHDEDRSLQYVFKTYLDEHDQSAECSLSLTFVNHEKETLLEMKVKRQTKQSWQDFIEKEFCQNNLYHNRFRLEMFNFRYAGGIFINLDDNIGDEDKTVVVMEATARDPWFVEDGMIKHLV